ncbi:hypothetical protein GGI55_001777 [Rhizobium leguminosarum]|uniref:hypothetical protein n=1 Tax=Rhizobium TaxID=379 RepID=UPI001607B488|nr:MULTISPECIES: hypothetical protein [Rhizobium]MBB4297250.1 hypothetical protein [Rhizobium leguminosarum]MBB4415324.1 hypothetical protein [Rhizobium leguminosarum]MBB4431709.1 hypothetical protein [Rhizobium esperanzae]MBB4539675.1 hypothetical protein [Rhizobium leguminosarum]MBB5651932.1 hypothetical protein [Rhizobium leguminosarum]
MKNWQVVVISIAAIVGGLLASGGVGQSETTKNANEWQMTTGPIAYLYNVTTKAVYACDYRPGIKPVCTTVTIIP